MANWRELGCVPNSDDDDFSDGELSTQEGELIAEDQEPEYTSDIEDQNEKNSRKEQAAVEVKEVEKMEEMEVMTVGRMASEETTTGPDQCMTSEEDTVMNDVVDKVYINTINHIPQAYQRTGLGLESGVSVLGSSDEKGAPTFDLGNQCDGQDSQARLGGAGRAVSEVDLCDLLDEEDIDLQNMQDIAGSRVGEEQEISSEQSRLSVAGEKVDFPANLNQGRTTPFENVSHPLTPLRGQEFRQPGQMVDSSSALNSSPLSSLPSTQVTLLPSSAPYQMTALTAAFHIEIPTREESYEQWAAPVRSFRERKPIQVNPYLIEGERYRQTLKSRGVKPLRIHEAELQVKGTHAGDNDSQEGEYVAPPDPDHRPRHKVPQVQNELQLNGEDNTGDELPTSTNAARDRPRPNKSPPSDAKRRKVARMYSKDHLARKANQTLRSPTKRKENTRPLLVVQTNGMASDLDIYDLPMNSPTQTPRTPLTQPNSSRLVPPSGEGSLAPVRASPGKRRGILSLLDSSSDSDLESNESNRTRPVSPTRDEKKPAPIIIPSSPPPLSSSSEDGDEGGEEDDEEDESRLITRFQRKTNGVLPASWWKLDKNKQTAGSNDNRRGQSPSGDNITPRPGVARIKISARARSPEGAFLLGDDSDSPSDGSIIASSIPARSILKKNAPPRTWIDLDDIMEDDKIDRMLPITSRNRKKKQTKRRQRADENQSTQRGLMESGSIGHASASRQGSGPTRLRQPTITDHVSSKKKATRRKKPTGPRFSIVDAVQHYKAKAAAPPPAFIKLAARAAGKRKDQGRQSPSRKLFVLETEMDTRDIQAVLRDWREGTLNFATQRDLGGSYLDSGLSQGRAHEIAAPRQMRFPSPQSLGESRGHPLRRQAEPSTLKPPQSRRHGGRQTTLSNIVRREPVSKGLISTTRPQPKPQANTVTTIPGRSRFVTHNPNFAPQPAQFEVAAPFNHTLRRLHQASRRAPTPDIAMLLQQTARRNPHLARFMEDEDLVQRLPRASPATHDSETAVPNRSSEMTKPSRVAPRVQRKRTPRRIDADTIERRQPPPQDTDIDNMDSNIPEDLPGDNKPVLRGLLPYGKRYSLNFDTAPLRPRTIFNSETFIGDGGLSRALKTQPVKDSRRNQGSSFTFGDKIVHWGIYEDSVSAEFEIIMNQIADITEKARDKDDLNGAEFHCLTSQVYSFYMFFSNYLAQVISFPDSIDIVSFGQRVLQAIDICCDRVVVALEGSDSHYNPKNSSTRLKLQILSFSLVFVFQMYQLASGDIEVQARLEVESSTRKFSSQLLSQLMKCGLDAVRGCYEDQRQQSKYERGIDREHYVAEAWVIAIQILGQIKSPDIGFWQFFNLELHLADLEKALDVRLFEKQWCMIFTILPLYQFDNLGISQRPINEHGLSENWVLLKTLIGRPLKVYNSNPGNHSSTIIDYCRVLYARCHHLISSWGWTNPDIIIPTLYEFFASNNLANLKNEDEYGSEKFLQDLEKPPSLVVQDTERCFHLLLKIVAIGINSMKTTSTTRKIGNLVNRLMPNHRRQYPREEGLPIVHLNALKNHHDLLATLYWAAPPNCRPHLDAIRNLVDPETSHRQACDVSMKTWSNLLRFQLHSGEDIKSLESFMEWFDDLVTQTLNQHHAARSEAEKQFKTAKDKGDTDLSEGLLKNNIRCNQIELESILNAAVQYLSTALSGIGGQIESATVIFTKVIANILNSHSRLSHKLVVEVLQLVQQYLLTCKMQEVSPSLTIQPIDEDSQDYGDWSGFDDLVVQDQRKPAAEHLLVVFYGPLHRMLSNCFGADKPPEESLLVKVVDTWALVAGFLVQNGLRTWGTYLDSYSSESWSSLRDTEQSRKFTAYFMPKIIQSGTGVYEANKTIFITFWLKTLVERESMLKFQNEYTTTLLNCDPINPIFSNLPFALDESLGKYNISQTDFRLRRLSLISTVLSNMRESFEAAVDDSAKKTLKQEYSQMLQAMMKSMKENYQELQTKSTPGAYVKFVQQVVEYLQQHWIDLISIDKFFTDSMAFPLPTNDPLYVVGRLRNYGLKLHYPRAYKALFSFFQSLCQRAAVDGQQEYLVSQLTTAFSGNFENSDLTKPTIRAFFLETIFPVYLECSFRESCGWILAVPILKASDRVILRMREDIDSTLYGCVKSVLSMLTSLLEGMRLAVSCLSPSKIMTPSALGTFTLMIITIARVIPIIDWLSASGDSVEAFAVVAYDCAYYLIKFSGYIRNLIENCEAEIPVDIRINQKLQGPHESARKDCAAAFKIDIKREWASHGGTWYASGREVCPPSLSGEQEGLEAQKKLLSKAVEHLLVVACRTEMFGMVARSIDANIWEFEGRGKPYNDCVRGQKQHGKALRALGNLFC